MTSYQHIQQLIRKIQELHYSVHVNEQEEDERERLLKRSLNKTLKRPQSYIYTHRNSPKLNFEHIRTPKGIAEGEKQTKIHNQPL